MKRNIILTKRLIAGIVLLASISCSREEPEIPFKEEQACVPVSLSLSVADMEAGTPETKTIMEPDNLGPGTSAQQIKDFYLLQFHGTDENANLITNKAFFTYQDVEDGNVKLVPSGDKYPGAFTIVVIANTPGEYINAPIDITLGQFLKGFSTIGNTDVFYKNDYLRMSGAVTVPNVDNTTRVSITLKRNVSKITINVKNETQGVDKVTLNKVQLRDVNAKYYYLTHLGGGINATFRDTYSPINPNRFDKAQETFPDAGNDGALQTFTYYIPANLRETNASTSQYTKGIDAPDGATRFCMYGTYGDGRTPINYTYYLGGNLVNDFNLKPNHHYTYNITLSSKGDSRYDHRVEDFEEVKFHIDANSYMVHPPLVQDQARVYAIPIRRAATFWNDPGVNGGVYGANRFDEVDYSSYQITPDTPWTAEVLWSDFELDPSYFLVKSAGTGYDPTDPYQDPYFKIRVKAGWKGNVVVAVKIGGNIAWSWHFWITDYNPDLESLIPEDGTYIYNVEGGQVHRYNSDIFRTEPSVNQIGYKNGFIMDRYLGASGASFDDSKKGTMFYQFGRKDPFFSYDQSGRVRYYTGGTTIATAPPRARVDTLQPSLRHIRYAVTHPTTFISGIDYIERLGMEWTTDDDLGHNNSLWLDDKYFDHTGDQEILEIKKSIYDPCPPGWKIPDYTAFSHLSLTSQGNIKDCSYLNHNGTGLEYYPGGDSNTGTIFFPSLCYRSWAGNFITDNIGNYGRIWSITPNGRNCRYFQFDQNKSYLSNNTQEYAYSVRCVREYGVVVK